MPEMTPRERQERTVRALQVIIELTPFDHPARHRHQAMLDRLLAELSTQEQETAKNDTLQGEAD
jgi:hypothetical protein